MTLSMTMEDSAMDRLELLAGRLARDFSRLSLEDAGSAEDICESATLVSEVTDELALHDCAAIAPAVRTL